MRDERIDYVRGLGIIFMVMAHAGGPWPNYIYIFHMSLFLICSGYCYKSGESIFVFCRKRIKTLYVPYIVMGIFVNLLNPLLATVGMIDKISYKEIINNIFNILLFKGGNIYIGQLWFLKMLFFALVLYHIITKILTYLIRSNSIRILVISIFSVIFLVVGYYAGIYVPNEFSWNICTAVIMIHLGVLIKKVDLINYLEKHNTVWIMIVGGGGAH